jgi:cobalt/nickel transport system ATP-binding protein
MSENKKNMAIEAKGVCYSYQEGTQTLSDVDLYAERGEFVAMLASNGSGKTTLIKVLVGLLKAKKGQVVVGGKEISEMNDSELYQQVGLVLQKPGDQLFAPTVSQDVGFGPRNLGLSSDEVKERVDYALAAVGAEHLKERAIHQLSYGEQKRVCVAGVLAMKPSILILDEPTAGLDPAGETKMIHLLNRLNREEKITIIMATHSVDMLPLFADRVYILKNGKVLAEGTAEKVFSDTELVDRASLRLPYISRLIHELRHLDGVKVEGLPLTINEARVRIMEVIPPELIMDKLREKEND